MEGLREGGTAGSPRSTRRARRMPAKAVPARCRQVTEWAGVRSGPAMPKAACPPDGVRTPPRPSHAYQCARSHRSCAAPQVTEHTSPIRRVFTRLCFHVMTPGVHSLCRIRPPGACEARRSTTTEFSFAVHVTPLLPLPSAFNMRPHPQTRRTPLPAPSRRRAASAPSAAPAPARSGKIRPAILLWALGVPIPLVLLFLLLRSCMT